MIGFDFASKCFVECWLMWELVDEGLISFLNPFVMVLVDFSLNKECNFKFIF